MTYIDFLIGTLPSLLPIILSFALVFVLYKFNPDNEILGRLFRMELYLIIFIIFIALPVFYHSFKDLMLK